MHCRRMYGHGRSLVEHYQNRPFALLGVNSDADQSAIRTVAATQEFPGRSWWDGNPGGPISSRYHVQGWPTVYVIDADGIIRHVGQNGLDAAVETLVREAEGKKR